MRLSPASNLMTSGPAAISRKATAACVSTLKTVITLLPSRERNARWCSGSKVMPWFPRHLKERRATSTYFVDADFSLLVASMWHREVETRILGNEQRRAGAGGRRNVRDAHEAFCILLLQHVEVAFAAADIQPLARRIIEQIVGVADDVEGAGLFSCRRVEYQDLGGLAASDKHATICLIERHGKIRFRSRHRPCGDNLHRGSVNHGDLTRRGYVHKHARARAFELKRFGMTGELCLAQQAGVGGIDGGQRTR